MTKRKSTEREPVHPLFWLAVIAIPFWITLLFLIF
jgi:hypothetical protein